MTLLGWAVYFGHSAQAEEVIKWALSTSNVNPFLPMREGFFRGKTVRDIAEHYQRKSIVQLIETCEKTKDESMRHAGDELKRELEAERPSGSGKVLVAVRPRRESKFVPIDTMAPADKKSKANERAKTPSPVISPKSASPAVALEEPKKAPSPVAEPEPVQESEPEPPAKAPSPEPAAQPVEKIDPKTTTVVGDQVMLSNSIAKTGHADVDSIKRNERSGMQRLAVKPVLAKASSSTLSKEPEPSPKAESAPRAPSPLVEDPAEKVIVHHEESNGGSKQPSETNVVPTIVPNGAAAGDLPVGKKYHVLLSYNWGKLQVTRQRARLLSKILEGKGLKVWLTEDHVEDDVLSAVQQGVEESVLIVVCLTKGYADRLAAYAKQKGTNPPLDWCIAEFNQSFSAISRANMTTVVMDSTMMDSSKWTGDMAMALKGQELVDFTTDKDWDGVGDRIAQLVRVYSKKN